MKNKHMPIDLRYGLPFFVSHREFIKAYDGNFMKDCLSNDCIIKTKKAFDKIYDDKIEFIKQDKTITDWNPEYFFDLKEDDARYSFLELLVFFNHFYSSFEINDDLNRRMLIFEFKIPFKTKISDASQSYSIIINKLKFNIPLSKILRIKGYPQLFQVDIIDAVIIFKPKFYYVNSKLNIYIFPKIFKERNLNWLRNSFGLYYKDKFYSIENESNLNIGYLHSSIIDEAKPSWFKTIKLSKLNGFKDLYIIDYRYFSNFYAYEQDKIQSIFEL